MDLTEDERKLIREYIGKYMTKQNLYSKNDATTFQVGIDTTLARCRHFSLAKGKKAALLPESDYIAAIPSRRFTAKAAKDRKTHQDDDSDEDDELDRSHAKRAKILQDNVDNDDAEDDDGAFDYCGNGIKEDVNAEFEDENTANEEESSAWFRGGDEDVVQSHLDTSSQPASLANAL
jgi:hypothetical protein